MFEWFEAWRQTRAGALAIRRRISLINVCVGQSWAATNCLLRFVLVRLFFFFFHKRSRAQIGMVVPGHCLGYRFLRQLMDADLIGRNEWSIFSASPEALSGKKRAYQQSMRLACAS